MNESVLILIFFIAGLLALYLFIQCYYTAQKRRDGIFLLAIRLSFEYSEFDPFDIPNAYAGFDWLSKGSERRIDYVFYGQLGNYDVKAFDYQYVTGSGKDRHKVKFSAVVFDTGLYFKSLLIRPESILDRVAGAMGFEDIDFESEEFSRAYYIKSPDKKFAYDIIYPQMMEYLLKYQGWSLSMLGRSIMVYTGNTFSPEEFERAISFGQGYLDLLPNYLREKSQITENM